MWDTLSLLTTDTEHAKSEEIQTAAELVVQQGPEWADGGIILEAKSDIRSNALSIGFDRTESSEEVRKYYNHIHDESRSIWLTNLP